MKGMPLGKKVPVPRGHDPGVLYPIPRKPHGTAMHGYDLWRSYELSWLNDRGRPHAGILEVIYPAQSQNIVESKSLKLYLGGLSFVRFGTVSEVEEVIRTDLARILAPEWILVGITEPEQFSRMTCRAHPDGDSLDDLDIPIDTYGRDPGLLSCGQEISAEILSSDLLRTNCPITGQPDWASVVIHYQGNKIDRGALLRYLCSYRDHEGFAEEVCELIFTDIMERCSPDMLSIRCCYTRRGGIDISPFRSSQPVAAGEIDRSRLVRQ